MYSLHKIPVSLIVFSLGLALSGNNPHSLPAGAADAGRGSVCVMKPGFWSSFRNPALLASFHDFSAGINYENRFNISELGSRTAAMIIPAGKPSLGIIYSHFGFSHFNRQTFGIACGTMLWENISAGVQIDYFFEKVSEKYDNIHSVTFEGGLTIRPAENINIGVHVFNPLPNSLRKRTLPSFIRAGAGIMLNENLFAGAEAEMCTGSTLILRTGFEYGLTDDLFVRGGFSSRNSSFSFGLGYSFDRISLDMSFAGHERLGITTSLSLIFLLRDQ